MTEEAPAVLRLRTALPKAIADTADFRSETTVWIPADRLLEAAQFLKEDRETAFNFLSDLAAVDRLGLGGEARFEVVYHLYSLERRHRLRLKVFAEGEPPTVPSVVSVWATANWHEREVYDLFGVHFEGHPNLSRLMMPEDWEGHPLRKDDGLARQEVSFSHNTPESSAHRRHMRAEREDWRKHPPEDSWRGAREEK